MTVLIWNYLLQITINIWPINDKILITLNVIKPNYNKNIIETKIINNNYKIIWNNNNSSRHYFSSRNQEGVSDYYVTKKIKIFDLSEQIFEE